MHARRLTRSLVVCAVAIGALATSPGASATPPGAGERMIDTRLGEAQASLAPVRSMVRRAREAFATGSLAASLADVSGLPAPVHATPSGADLSSGAAVGILIETVRRAVDAVGGARTRDVLRAARAIRRAQENVTAGSACRGSRCTPRIGPGHTRADRATERVAASPVVARFMDVTETEAVRVAAAIDAAIPALQLMPVSSESTSAPCDVVNQAPLVCISGDGATEYPPTHDYALTIDVGGDDVYRNGAGASTQTTSPVQINVDLAGNDRYAAEVPTAQGVGASGIGFLVDLGGADSYRMDAWSLPATSNGAPPGVMAQGVALLGVGALWDAGGADDTYQAVGPVATAQAYGAVGPALLADDGGDDRYEVLGSEGTASDSAMRILAGSALYGQGYAILGAAAVLFDGGGRDVLDMEVHGGFSAPADAGYIGTLRVQGQGYAGSGTSALVLTGAQGAASDTVYRLRADATGMIYTNAWGQGNAETGGVAAVDDLSGDDRYELAATRTQRYEADQQDPDLVVAEGDYNNGNVAVQALGQGSAMAADIGAVLDHGGNDAYDLIARDDFDVRAVDGRSGGQDGPVAEVFGSKLAAWGQGTSFAYGAHGGLVDDGGDDVYRMRAEQNLNAEAVARVGGPQGSSAAYSNADEFPYTTFYVRGQGAGDSPASGCSGCLLDLGGIDRYESTLEVTATSSPDADNVSETAGRAAFQGEDGGLFFDHDDGQQDSYLLDTSFPRCSGYQGETGVWLGCGRNESDSTDVGVGYSSSAPGRAAVTITPAPDNPAAATVGDRINVSAAVTGPDGQPLAGVPVSFRLNFWWPYAVSGAPVCTPVTGSCLSSMDFGPAREVVTGPDGVARTTLVLWGTDSTHAGFTISEFMVRFYATTPRLSFIAYPTATTRQAEATEPLALTAEDS